VGRRSVSSNPPEVARLSKRPRSRSRGLFIGPAGRSLWLRPGTTELRVPETRSRARSVLKTQRADARFKPHFRMRVRNGQSKRDQRPEASAGSRCDACKSYGGSGRSARGASQCL
jgi:hypothetical protein